LALWVLASIGNYIANAQDSTSSASLLAFGDVNLGRSVGQEILKGNITYPFDNVGTVLSQADLVFVNLESQLSDRQGETQHPKYNLIFCGPPLGAQSLKKAGITVVSTANNHAFDYNLRALKETVRYLRNEGIQFTGTNDSGDSIFDPLIVERNGIRIGFVAYTSFVNAQHGWQGYISDYDSARARAEIRHLRKSVDVIVASLHGGVEYVEAPDRETLYRLHLLATLGADVVLGHHSHVPQGIEGYKNSWIFNSLGNFVFFQPQLEWTQKSFGAQIRFEKNARGTKISRVTLLPFRAGKQPSFTMSQVDIEQMARRLRRLSNTNIEVSKNELFVNIQ
jgi:poly-gamma-glutamate synthesis protein (capsule biosynthesis protein)